MDKKTIDRIKELLEELRPYFNGDGGDLEFIKYEDNYVYVKLLGQCNNCPMADVTLKDGVEFTLINEIPEVTEVININQS